MSLILAGLPLMSRDRFTRSLMYSTGLESRCCQSTTAGTSDGLCDTSTGSCCGALPVDGVGPSSAANIASRCAGSYSNVSYLCRLLLPPRPRISLELPDCEVGVEGGIVGAETPSLDGSFTAGGASVGMHPPSCG